MKKVIDDNRAMDVVHKDFSEAFDTFPRGRPIQKIKMHGIGHLDLDLAYS